MGCLAAQKLFRFITPDFFLSMSTQKKPTVLVIDDDEDYLDILKLGLGDEFDMRTIVDFDRLEVELNGIYPSLILVDKNLGEIDAEKVIDTIRGFDTLREIPVILMSGSGLGSQESLVTKFEGFMMKPSSFQEVRERLRATLALY